MIVAEQIGLLNTAATAAVDPDTTYGDGFSIGSNNAPFIHGRDYVVDASSYRHAGTADHSKVMLTYRLLGEPIKNASALPTGETTSGSSVIISLSFTAGIQVGMRITGPGIPPDTFVAAINVPLSLLNMTRAATASAAGVTLAINSVFVGKVREWKFIRQMLGYPYQDYDSAGGVHLRRNLPEPIRWGTNISASTGAWRFQDNRPFLRVTANTNSSTQLNNILRVINGVSAAGAVNSPSLVGAKVYGPGIPANTTVAAFVSTSELTLSQAATATAANQTITIVLSVDRTNRFTHWCTAFGNVRGASPKAQNPATSATMYPHSSFLTVGQPPEPQFVHLDIDFTFEQLPYECRLVIDPTVRGAAIDYGGEYSRFVIYPEEASARLLQIRGGAFWDVTTGGFGQPYFTLNGDTHNGTAVIDNISSTANLGPGMAVTGVGIGAGAVIATVDSATQVTLKVVSTATATVAITFSGLVLSTVPFAGKEGLPKTIGENVFTWKWIDVPIWAYDWDAIQASFGKINSADFGSTLTAPFYTIRKECCLLETAQRIQKNNVMGEPIWDIIFYMRHCPLNDKKGYWNRLYNNLGFPQRYRVGNQDFFLSFDFANLFRPYGQWV